MRRPLWPLLPPAALLGLMVFFMGISRWIGGPLSECGFLKLTGFYCAGCGGTRCAQSIFTGNWIAAFNYNPMLMTGFVLFLAFSLYLIVRITIVGKPAPKLPNINGQWIWAGVASIILFTILRNIPAYPFDLLAP